MNTLAEMKRRLLVAAVARAEDVALVFAEQEFMNLASDDDAAAFKSFCRETAGFIRALERRPHNTCDMFTALKERYPDIMRTPLDDANERIKRLEAERDALQERLDDIGPVRTVV